MYLAASGLFALFGASAKLLYKWEPRPWRRSVGTLMVSVFAAWVTGLYLWDTFQSRPAMLLAIVGSASWAGTAMLDRLGIEAKRLLGGGN